MKLGLRLYLSRLIDCAVLMAEMTCSQHIHRQSKVVLIALFLRHREDTIFLHSCTQGPNRSREYKQEHKVIWREKSNSDFVRFSHRVSFKY